MNRTFRTPLALRGLKVAATGIAGALALIASAPAAANVITFDHLDNPLQALDVFTGGDQFSEAGYTMTVLDSIASAGGGASGMIADGQNQYTCDISQCPSGNDTHYFLGLNDGGLTVARSDSKAFQLKGLDYSFMAPIGGLQNFNYGQLSLTATLQGGGTIHTQFDFPTQDLDGLYNFGPATLAAGFQNATVTSLNISACLFGTDGVCYNPADNQAQFGIDNLSVSAVPEPETYAMLLAGLAAMGALSRRRTPAAAPNNLA
ncbi:MAG: NF038120 family PEP-CTERM protein [Sphingomonadaceae bacterium]